VPKRKKDGDPVPRPSSATRDASINKDHEARVRQCRERQEEDRRRKLEELKQQALAAQKFREQQEEERRRHIEEVRERENQRRQQVEERKRALVEADKERKEQIIKRNQVAKTEVLQLSVLSFTIRELLVLVFVNSTCKFELRQSSSKFSVICSSHYFR
jgi:hypothetical protein